MVEQLIKKNCPNGQYSNIHPMTTLDAVIDKDGKTLEEILSHVNHIYLPFKDNTRRATRLQVPAHLRRKGLWVTYITCKNNVVTEWYNGDNTNDAQWADGDNWIPYMDQRLINSLIKETLSWYKA